MTKFSEIFLFMPMLTSLFWAFLIFITKKRTYPQTILGFFMILEVILYSCHSVFFAGDKYLYLKFDAVYNFVRLCTYPTYYLYVRLLTVDETVKKKHFKHFIIPLLIFIAMLFLHVTLNIEDKIEYLNDTIGNQKIHSSMKGSVLAISIIFFIGKITFAFQAIFYLIKSYLLSIKYNKNIDNFYSNTKGKSLAWLKNIIIAILITTIISFTVNIIGRNYFAEHNNNLLFIPSILFTSIIFILGYQGYKQNYNIKNFNLDLCEIDDIQKKHFNQRKIFENIDFLIRKEKLFLESNLTICKLSNILKINRTYLSNTINNELNMSFNDYVNKERILYAEKLIKKDTKNIYTLNYIAEESGFGSFSSFNRAFKKFKNITATNYRLKKVIPKK